MLICVAAVPAIASAVICQSAWHARTQVLACKLCTHFARSLKRMVKTMRLLEELGDDLSGTVNFELGYYEKRSTKCLVTTNEDL